MVVKCPQQVQRHMLLKLNNQLSTDKNEGEKSSSYIFRRKGKKYSRHMKNK
uniref:Uncharacterized protein n=1 Tax=Rhizophora mucronata TaxID=61149 RepID=A0A2P2NZB9_RHIMU